jgi:hypothetical protein
VIKGLYRIRKVQLLADSWFTRLRLHVVDKRGVHVHGNTKVLVALAASFPLRVAASVKIKKWEISETIAEKGKGPIRRVLMLRCAIIHDLVGMTTMWI